MRISTKIERVISLKKYANKNQSKNGLYLIAAKDRLPLPCVIIDARKSKFEVVKGLDIINSLLFFTNSVRYIQRIIEETELTIYYIEPGTTDEELDFFLQLHGKE